MYLYVCHEILRFAYGGGCSIGFGVGWGFFLAGYGVVVKSIRQLLGFNQRLLRKAYETMELEREAGLRPPLQSITSDDTGIDPFLDRVIRQLEQRRTRRNAVQSTR